MQQGKLYVDFGMWGIVRKVAVAFFGLVMLAFLVLYYIPTLRETGKLEKEIEEKRAAIKKQQDLQQKYHDEILALRADPEAVVRSAREKLNLVKPEETIYHFESSDRPK